MSTSDQAHGGHAAEDDIDAWMAGLRGQGNDPEAQVIRRLLREDGPGMAEPLDEHAWQRLRFRLKREGLLKTESIFQGPKLYALAASLFALAVTWHFLAPSAESPDLIEAESAQVRGEEAIPTFVLRNPAALATTLADGLAGLAIPVRKVQQADSTWLLEARVPESARQPVQELFSRQRLPAMAIPPNGQLRLILKTKP